MPKAVAGSSFPFGTVICVFENMTSGEQVMASLLVSYGCIQQLRNRSVKCL